MKTKKILILASVFVALATLTTGCKKEIEVKDGSKVAVSVKGKKVTATEFYDSIKENNISELVDMIDHGLFDKKYPSDEKEKEIDEQVNQLKSIYGKDENTFKTVLNQGFGVNSEEELREMLSLEHKRNLAVNDYIKDHLKDDEIEKYYQENIFGEAKASHILISLNVKEDASDEEKEEAQKVALEKAKKVIKELKDGKDFKKLAKKYSDDEKTAKNGGDLGFFNYDEMEDSFSEACKDLKKKNIQKNQLKQNMVTI